MALTTIPSELSSVSGISDSSTSTAITINSSQNVTFSGNISTGSNTISGVLSSVTGSIGSAATATTQAASDNSTKLATTAYVTTALANLVDSAPGTLNTLNELAAALGDDANFSTTVTNSIAGKVALSGGAQTIADSSDFTIDAAADIILDAGGGDWRLKDDGTTVATLSNVSGDLQILLGQDKDYKFVIDDNGSQSTALLLDGSEGGIATFGSGINIGNRGSASDPTLQSSIDPNTGIFWGGGDILGFSTGGSERMRIDASGNITQTGGDFLYSGGINWDIKHNGAGQSIVFSTTPSGGSATAVFRIGADGDVFSVTPGLSNVRYGENAGDSIAAGGNYNTLIGGNAGTNITTGDRNVAVGFGALQSEDGHGYNVAVGYAALDALNAGADAYNVAVGYAAGNNMSTGTSNTLVGAYSGDAITSGTQNTAVGYNSLTANTTASHNTAVGWSALKANTEGDLNTALGFGAMETNILGDRAVAVGTSSLALQNQASRTDTYNVAVGYAAGYNVTTGVQNTLIGGQAGDAINTGIQNVAVGYDALSNLTTGGYNTAVGREAARNLSGATAFCVAVGRTAGITATTSDNCTWIGGRAGPQLNTSTGNNNIAVGYQSGASCTTGNSNVVVGSSAFYYGTTGASNVIVGHGASGDNTGNHNALSDSVYVGYLAGYAGVGNSTVAIGYEAGYRNYGGRSVFAGFRAGGYANSSSSGNHNVALGYQALYSIQGSSDNVSIGTNSGYSLTSGHSNVFVGREAGYHGTATTGGSNNIIIGAYSNTSQASSDTEVVVGYNVTGRGNSTFTTGKAGSWVGLAFGSTTVSSSSDERLKENIQNSTAGLSFINDLRPVTFEWKKAKDIPETFKDYDADSEERVMGGDGVYHGFIAQEVKTAIDNHDELKDGFDMWSETSDGTQAVGDAALIPMLVKSIQELSAEVTSLKAEVAALKGE